MDALDNADGREIVAYHWHPDGRGHVRLPHLHLGAGAMVGRGERVKAHLLTGVVTPAVALLLAIESFGVPPRRADWGARLHQAHDTLQPA